MATVIGAVIVALIGIVIGAHYASIRLIAQLDEQRRWEDERRDEEARRLQVQLDAEAERQRHQLTHDRHMRDREGVISAPPLLAAVGDSLPD